MTKKRAKKKNIFSEPTALDVLEAFVLVGRTLSKKGVLPPFPSLVGVVEEVKNCTCTAQDLQPKGECICTPIPVRKEPKVVCCIGCTYPDCYCQK